MKCLWPSITSFISLIQPSGQTVKFNHVEYFQPSISSGITLRFTISSCSIDILLAACLILFFPLLCVQISQQTVYLAHYFFFFLLLQLGFQFDFIRSAVLRSLHLSCQPQTKPPRGLQVTLIPNLWLQPHKKILHGWCFGDRLMFLHLRTFFLTDLLSLFCMVGTFG